MDPKDKEQEPAKPEAKPAAKPEASGPVDVDAILAKAQIEPQFKSIYDKAVLSGLRFMFDKKSHAMVSKYLDGEGFMADKIAQGVVGVVYMLWDKSNKTLPPQIIVPLTFALTLHAFDYLQKSEDPDATKETLGEAMEKSVTLVMQKFDVSPEQIEQVIAQQKARVGAKPAASGAPAAAPAAPKPGILGQEK